MTLSPLWDVLRRELDAWAEHGKVAPLWLRDDDAVRPTPALDRFARLTYDANVPAVLAVIPAPADPTLADYLTQWPNVDVAVHGYAHTNHAPAGRKSEEFPVTRATTEIRSELSGGLHRLRSLFGPRALPLYVPPWNRLSREVAGLLPDLGFTALSGFGPHPILGQPARLVEINTHIDIIDWRRNRGGRDHARLVATLAAALRAAPLGILTHHLVHDTAAWTFLEHLFDLTSSHPAVRWSRAADLVVR